MAAITRGKVRYKVASESNLEQPTNALRPDRCNVVYAA